MERLGNFFKALAFVSFFVVGFMLITFRLSFWEYSIFWLLLHKTSKCVILLGLGLLNYLFSWLSKYFKD